MKPSIHHTILPPKYKKYQRGTKEFVKAFNNWTMYIRGENLDNSLVYEAKKLLK